MSPEEIEHRVSDAIRTLQHEIDSTLFCPRASFAIDRVLLTVASRGLRIGLAVCHLVAGGFYGEAFGLTRSVLEAFFIVKYVASPSKDGEDRARSYLEFRKTYFYNQEENRKKYFPNEERPAWLTQEMLDEVKKLFPNTRHWIPAYSMAADYFEHPLDVNPQTGKGFQALNDYDGMYEMTSHYVHVTAISSGPTFDASPFRTAKRDTEEDRAILALHFSLAYLFELCIILGRHFDCGLPDHVHQTIRTLLEDLRAFKSVSHGLWMVGR
jgi:hypothetical protein